MLKVGQEIWLGFSWKYSSVSVLKISHDRIKLLPVWWLPFFTCSQSIWPFCVHLCGCPYNKPIAVYRVHRRDMLVFHTAMSCHIIMYMWCHSMPSVSHVQQTGYPVTSQSMLWCCQTSTGLITLFSTATLNICANLYTHSYTGAQ